MDSRNNNRKKMNVIYLIISITGVIALFVAYMECWDSVKFFHTLLAIELLIYIVVSIIRWILRKRR